MLEPLHGEDLVVQAMRNLAKTFGGRTKVLLEAIAKEIIRLKRVQEAERDRERIRRFKENAAAKKAGAELPWPETDDDIPF